MTGTKDNNEQRLVGKSPLIGKSAEASVDRQAAFHLPPAQGLYDPAHEKDSCGVGFIAHIKGVASHQNVIDADTILQNMDHRGACGCEPNTGDGSGIMCGLPHKFLRKVAKRDLDVDLPEPDRFAAGLVFLPQDDAERDFCKRTIEQLIAEYWPATVGLARRASGNGPGRRRSHRTRQRTGHRTAFCRCGGGACRRRVRAKTVHDSQAGQSSIARQQDTQASA